MSKRYRRYYSRSYSNRRNNAKRIHNNPSSISAMITEAAALLVGLLLIIALFTKNGWLWVLFAVLIGCIPVIMSIRKYRKGAYYQITKNTYLSVLLDKGKYGEYLTYKYLKQLEADGAKFLFNAYIPKENGETTEIDVLMICSKGVFVFESKNYSGWIFGSERQMHWYQTLPSGRKSHKEQFYNPIMQNNSHIKWLKTMLGEQIPMHSVIVFSERCTLKSVQVQSKHIRVINRQDIEATVFDICNQNQGELLDASHISSIYEVLYPYTQVDKNTKAKHIENIRNYQDNRTDQTSEGIDVPPITEVNLDEVAENDSSMNVVDSIEATEHEDATEAIDNKEHGSQEHDATQGELTTPQCPWCKGKLVLRTAARGTNAGKQFYGCSNYPRCKYVKNLTDMIVQ